jgi:hypothetical protein
MNARVGWVGAGLTASANCVLPVQDGQAGVLQAQVRHTLLRSVQAGRRGAHTARIGSIRSTSSTGVSSIG